MQQHQVTVVACWNRLRIAGQADGSATNPGREPADFLCWWLATQQQCKRAHENIAPRVALRAAASAASSAVSAKGKF